MARLKVWYGKHPYISHRRVALTYIALLQDFCEIVGTIIEADVVILHLEPHDYQSLFSRYPELSDKYVISYSVWEASSLPASYRTSLQLVQEVWTCSNYSLRAFQTAHSNVHLIPHVIERDISYTTTDDHLVKRLLSFEEECLYLLNVTHTCVPRKNIEQLCRIFTESHNELANARLILKTSQDTPRLNIDDDRVIFLPLNLSDSQLNALYSHSSLYVSAHHSEGWGLPLSDAFLFSKPVIATGYSGNMEFMTSENSYLVSFTEETIRDSDLYGAFTQEMSWAYPSDQSLYETILSVCGKLGGPDVLCKVERALQTCQLFTKTRVAKLIYARMSALGEVSVAKGT